jgi:hypothetical protein
MPVHDRPEPWVYPLDGAFSPARRREMTERKPADGDVDQTKGECREHREEMLDEALEETFPASDPPSLTWPPAKPC